MILPHVTRGADGSFVLDGLDLFHAAVLPQVPRLIAPDETEDVRDRFLQLPSEDDDERNEEWRRLVHPEIFSLLASAREIVERDLESGFSCREDAPIWRVVIPEKHLDAWIAAINAARLALGTRYAFTEEEMNEYADAGSPDRAAALATIQILGAIEWMLVENVLPPPDQDADAQA